jgi:erythromycin esterase-like protein
LIAEQGFTAVAVEGDWPDAYRVNRYVHGESDDRMPKKRCPISGALALPAPVL